MEHVLYVEKKCSRGSRITTTLRNDVPLGLSSTSVKDRRSYLVVMFSILAVFEAGWNGSRSVPHVAARCWHLHLVNKTEIKMVNLVRMRRLALEAVQEVQQQTISKRPHILMAIVRREHDSQREPELSS